MIHVVSFGDGSVALLRGEDVLLVDPHGHLTPERTCPGGGSPVGSVLGVLGLVTLAAIPHLVCIDSISESADLEAGRKRIHCVESVLMVPLTPSPLLSDELSVQGSFQKFLQGFEFHYSPDYDFTHTLQRLGDGPMQPCDRRFFWNAHLARRFSQAGQEHWITCVCDAFVGTVAAGSVQYVLISRRSRRRHWCCRESWW